MNKSQELMSELNEDRRTQDLIMQNAQSYAKTLEDLSKGMNEYIKRKLERRVMSDYANSDDKLKSIFKSITAAELATAKAYKAILSEVG